MLTQYTRYALKALLFLAENPRETPHSVAEIAERSDVPRKFLETILADLKRRGIVISTRGQRGGYRLARPADQLSFAAIIGALDGPVSAMMAAGEQESDGDHFDQALHNVMAKASARLTEALEAATLASALNDPIIRRLAKRNRQK